MTILEALKKTVEEVKIWAEEKFFNRNNIDAELNSTSENPVQNKVVHTEISNLKDLIGDIDVSDQIEDALDSVVYSDEFSDEISSLYINADTLGGIPASDYATKDDLNKIDFPVDSVNGKAGAVQLTATDVGSRPNTWLPTIAEIGAAPSGYGLGEINGMQLTANVDVNNVVMNGFYWWTDAPINAPMSYCAMRVFGGVGAYTIQEVITGNLYHSNVIMRRFTGGGRTAWGEWEYENPPMLLGVEYRTTERWNGNEVYTMLVNCGALPTSGTTQVSCLPGWYKIIRCEGSTSDGWAFPVLTSSGNCFVSACGNSVYFQTTRDLSNQTADVQLWYVK